MYKVPDINAAYASADASLHPTAQPPGAGGYGARPPPPAGFGSAAPPPPPPGGRQAGDGRRRPDRPAPAGCSRRCLRVCEPIVARRPVPGGDGAVGLSSYLAPPTGAVEILERARQVVA